MGWIAQWAMKVGQCDVEFIPRWTIKSQALIDFNAGWMNLGLRCINDLLDHWIMYFDGSYTLKGVGAGVVLIPSEGDMLKYVFQIEFPTTKNMAECDGLVTGFRLAKGLDIWSLLIRGDSQLVAKQVQKEYNYNNDKMAEYLAEV
jgi:hypothetical protein